MEQYVFEVKLCYLDHVEACQNALRELVVVVALIMKKKTAIFTLQVKNKTNEWLTSTVMPMSKII